MHRHLSFLLGTAAAIAAVLPASAMAGRAEGHRDTTLAVYGDAPYFDKTVGSGDQKLQQSFEFKATPGFIDAINDDPDVQAVVHVGDIHSGQETCREDYDRAIFDLWKSYEDPLVYTPGDNEWADCWEAGAGSFRPLERLGAIRAIFFDDPRRSLGRAKLDLETQAGGGFPENARWTHDGVVFATVDLVGSLNARKPYPGRTTAEDEASIARTEGDTAWMRAAFDHARAIDAKSVVIAFHANPEFEGGPEDRYRRSWEPFLMTLEEEAARFDRPVLVVHGDGHDYKVDHPTRARSLTRMQVPGSPRVGWVRVVVDPTARDPFSFDEHVVPRWKYW
jgi:hypothetical protein